MRGARLAASEGGALQKRVEQHPALRPSEWRVDVAFKGSGGALAVECDGVVEGVTPDELLELVTGAAGDKLFGVAERAVLERDAAGAPTRIEVVNRAPVRVLWMRLHTVSRVRVDISRDGVVGVGGVVVGDAATASPPSVVSFSLVSGNMLSELEGAWTLTPLPRGGGVSGSSATTAAASRLFGGRAAARGSTTTSATPSATRVAYVQRVRPRGLPPGVRLVPGISDAVRASVGRETRQLLDKVSWVASKVSPGVPPGAALAEAVREVEAAGGTFKLLRAAAAARCGGAGAALLEQLPPKRRRTVASDDGEGASFVVAPLRVL